MVRPAGPAFEGSSLANGASACKLGWWSPSRRARVEDDALLVLASSNLQRWLTIEEAEGYRTLADRFGFTQEEIAGRRQGARPWPIGKLLKLAPSIRRLVKPAICRWDARALIAIEVRYVQPTSRGRRLRKIGRCVRWSGALADRGEERRAPEALNTGDPKLRALEEALRNSLRACRSAEKKGTGVIEVPFHGSEDFERLFVLLAGREASEILADDGGNPSLQLDRRPGRSARVAPSASRTGVCLLAAAAIGVVVILTAMVSGWWYWRARRG
jgi:hypothetical protein